MITVPRTLVHQLINSIAVVYGITKRYPFSHTFRWFYKYNREPGSTEVWIYIWTKNKLAPNLSNFENNSIMLEYIQAFLNTEAKPCFVNTCEESCERLERKLNKQYHTENQGLRSRTIFLLIDQFKTSRERPKSAPRSRFK